MSRMPTQEQRAKLIAKLTQKSSKNKFEDYFVSNKNPKYMLSSFQNTYQNELIMQGSHEKKQQFRGKLFKEQILHNLGAKQYKRRKNAFYVLNFLVQTDSHFAEVSLKEFYKIKNVLFQHDNLPSLSTIEMIQDFLKFKMFINSRVLEWIDKYQSRYPDLHIWKKAQSSYFSINDRSGEGGQLSEKFEEKYQQLKIYKTIFTRNVKEIEQLQDNFQTVRYESLQARRFMEDKEDIEEGGMGSGGNDEHTMVTQQEEEKKDGGQQQQQVWEYEMQAFVDKQEQEEGSNNILFMDDDEQQHSDDEEQNNMSDNNQQCEQEAAANQANKMSINIDEQIILGHKFPGSEKNSTLFRVIQDNKKQLERKYVPLLEMFKMECIYFREVQCLCLKVVHEKKDLQDTYRGRIKINKKEAAFFDKEYTAVSEAQIIEQSQTIERLLKQVNELKQDLGLIQLAGSEITHNQIVILDEEFEDDPDEKFFN